MSQDPELRELLSPMVTRDVELDRAPFQVDRERVLALFWEGRVPARERFVDADALVEELAGRLRERFEPSGAEVALSEARRIGGMAGAAALRRLADLRSR